MTTTMMKARNIEAPNERVAPNTPNTSAAQPSGTTPAIPRTMRAAVFDRHGTPEVLELREIPTPSPGPDEVLVRVHAAGLNPKDSTLRERATRGRGAAPRGTGFDLAGEVVALGDAVHDIAPGARVWGFLDGVLGGTAAEYVAVKRAWIARMPRALGWSEAAALPLAGSAALQALRDVARLRAGERVLIKGASGGVGSAAIQIAKAFGAHVTAQVSAPARDAAIAHVRALDADAVIDDAPGTLASVTGRYDVFVDCAGGSSYGVYRRVLARGGRWVTVAPNLAVFARAPISALTSRVVGGPRLGFVIVRPRSSDLDALADLVARGALRMPVAAEFSLASIVEAHRALTARGVLGKRVVRVVPADAPASAAEPRRPSRATRAASTAAASLRAEIDQLLMRSRVPGCSIALVDRDGLRWADGFGFADLRAGRRAEADTVYHLFSGTKLFTAAAIMQLVECGRLSLDDSIARHVPEAEALRGITLRHLLSHRSGLKESLRGLLATTFPGEAMRTAEEALSAFPLAASRAPGTRVEYRNTNYALLGAVVSRVSGLEYRQYVRERLLVPLQAECAFTIHDAMRPRAATGYMDRWDPMRLVLRVLYPQVAQRLYGARVGGLVELEDYDLSTAAIGGLVGTVPGFARFLQSQLAGGAPVLGEGAVREMQTMIAEGAAGIESRVGVGLGWKIGRVGDRTFLNHEGGGAGFTSELRLYPREGVGIAIAMNAMRMPKTMRLAHRLCERVMLSR